MSWWGQQEPSPSSSSSIVPSFFFFFATITSISTREGPASASRQEPAAHASCSAISARCPALSCGEQRCGGAASFLKVSEQQANSMMLSAEQQADSMLNNIDHAMLARTPWRAKRGASNNSSSTSGARRREGCHLLGAHFAGDPSQLMEEVDFAAGCLKESDCAPAGTACSWHACRSQRGDTWEHDQMTCENPNQM